MSRKGNEQQGDGARRHRIRRSGGGSRNRAAVRVSGDGMPTGAPVSGDPV
ncbi:hypothetical protein GZL_03277 [Streptomyces sp. 769]|nr:hypothetical protein GZL_03277 [Streptomyces sp. 769]